LKIGEIYLFISLFTCLFVGQILLM